MPDRLRRNTDLTPVLYVTDLDGTLLQNDASLSPTTRQLLNERLAEGAPITVASARSVVSIRSLLAEIELTLPVIEFNGAFLSDLATGEHLWINSLPEPVLLRAFDTVTAHAIPPFLSTFDGQRDRLYAPPPVNAGMDWYVEDRVSRRDDRLIRVDDVSRGLGDRVVCITVIERVPALEALRQDLVAACADRLKLHLWENSYDPGWHWLTIHDPRATKDQAVTGLAAHLGLDAVEIVAFGDQQNDTQMLQAADRGVAVANAVDEVKAAADVIIGPNTEDSVMRYISQDWAARR